MAGAREKDREHKRVSAETYSIRGEEARPVDRVASRVTAPGVHWEPGFKPPCQTWKGVRRWT